jgi:hypothetical protein
MNIILFFPKNKIYMPFQKVQMPSISSKRVLLLLLLLLFLGLKNRDLKKKIKSVNKIMGLNFASLFTSIPCEASCY